jgi:hypothetical protein
MKNPRLKLLKPQSLWVKEVSPAIALSMSVILCQVPPIISPKMLVEHTSEKNHWIKCIMNCK